MLGWWLLYLDRQQLLLMILHVPSNQWLGLRKYTWTVFHKSVSKPMFQGHTRGGHNVLLWKSYKPEYHRRKLIHSGVERVKKDHSWLPGTYRAHLTSYTTLREISNVHQLCKNVSYECRLASLESGGTLLLG